VEIETGVRLARLTTIGTGGPARAFARPGSVTELEEAVAWAVERGLELRTVGLGSNLLASDDGVEALVLRMHAQPLVREHHVRRRVQRMIERPIGEAVVVADLVRGPGGVLFPALDALGQPARRADRLRLAA